ncbi:MAG: DUF5723 family protein [Tannerellaceae bacterium]
MIPTTTWALLYRNGLSLPIMSLCKYNTFNELTLSGNYRPLSWLALSLSYGFVHSGFQTFGWAVNISP